MSELRWILLLVGVLFLILLTAWESRRARLARAAAFERARARAETIPFEQAGADAPVSALAPVAHAGSTAADSARSSEELAELEAPLMAPAIETADPPLGELPSVPLQAHAEAASLSRTAALRAEAAAEPAVPALDSAPAGGAAEQAAGADRGAADAAGASGQGVSVEWPPEEQRHIISVRIVSTSEQRLSGRATRQALAACGFVHGRYRIFHQPDEQGHALLSCASLSKPGVFDPGSMDYQRYSGLSLFTVLPGPLSPPEAVDHLLYTALDLSERLQARLQDDEGQALDAARITELRTRYREPDAPPGPAA